MRCPLAGPTCILGWASSSRTPTTPPMARLSGWSRPEPAYAASAALAEWTRERLSRSASTWAFSDLRVSGGGQGTDVSPWSTLQSHRSPTSTASARWIIQLARAEHQGRIKATHSRRLMSRRCVGDGCFLVTRMSILGCEGDGRRRVARGWPKSRRRGAVASG